MPVAGSSGLPRPVHWRELPPGSRTLCPRSPPHPPSPPGTFQGPPSVVPPPAPPAPALSDPSRTGRAAGVSQSLPGADPEAGRASAAPRWSLGRAQYDVGKAGFTARHLPPEPVQGLTSARLLLLPECRPHGLPSPPPPRPGPTETPGPPHRCGLLAPTGDCRSEPGRVPCAAGGVARERDRLPSLGPGEVRLLSPCGTLWPVSGWEDGGRRWCRWSPGSQTGTQGDRLWVLFCGASERPQPLPWSPSTGQLPRGGSWAKQVCGGGRAAVWEATSLSHVDVSPPSSLSFLPFTPKINVKNILG